MDELVMNEDFTVNEFLDQMLDAKNQSQSDVVGNINGFPFSTEGCTTRSQLQNKLAGEMHNYIMNGERNEQPTKRQFDAMVMMLDESIAPSANWDDPADVLDWMEASSDRLNDPELARTVYEDGKTPAEIMVERLKEHGYGQVSENLSEAEKAINAKISDLENHGFLMTDFFNGEVPMHEYEVENQATPTATVQEQPQDSSDFESSFFVKKDKNPIDSFQSATTDFENSSVKDSMNSQNVSPLGEIDSALQDDEYQFFSQDGTIPEATEDDYDEEDLMDEDALEKGEDEFSEESSITSDSEKESFIEQDQTPEVTPEQSFFTKREKSMGNDTELDFFTKKEKPVRTGSDQDFFTKKEKSAGTDSEQGFFVKKDKDSEIDNRMNTIRHEFNVPSEDIQENLAAISWALSTRKAEDIAQAEIALSALPESQITEYYRDQINFVKASLERDNENDLTNSQMESNPLEAFQAKYGPTANEKEMEIVHKIENDLETLRERKQEIKEELLDVQTKLKESKPTRSNEPVNIANKRNSDLAIQEVKEKARLSTAVMRNNAAMPDFYKAAETHKIIDIVRATNGAKALGPNHTFTNTLTKALNEIANTYYGKTPEELQEQLVESTKQFNEAQQLLVNNPDETVYSNQLESVKAAFNQMATDRSKEKIFAAMIEVQALGETHPYSKTLTKTLDQIATIYHGKTASQIKNQIIGCSKACNEAQEEIERTALRSKENYGNITQSELDLHYVKEALNKAVMNHSKENILVALNYAQKLDPKSPSAVALNNALNRLAVTHLDTTLNELRWQDMRNALDNVKENSSSINNTEAMQRFNQAVQSHTKADIIVALNMAKELENGYELVGALNKMSRNYYGVDAETLTQQFRNYSVALNKVKDMTAPNNTEIPADAKENDAMSSFYKAVQTKDEADIMEAIQNVNRLPDYHPMKKPLLDALNAQLLLVGKYEPVIEEIEEEVQENTQEKEALKAKATSLIEEYKDVESKIAKRENSLNQFAENKKKQKEDLEKQQALEKQQKEKDLEPPAKVIKETTNHNPNLFKKAVAGAKKALKDMSLKKVAKVAVIGAGIYFAPVLMVALYAGKKIFIDPNKKEDKNKEEGKEQVEKKEKKKKVKKVRKVKKKKSKPVFEDDYEDIDYENSDLGSWQDDYDGEETEFEDEVYYDEDNDFVNEEETYYDDEDYDETFDNEPVSEESTIDDNVQDSEEVVQRIMEAESQARGNRSQEDVQFYRGNQEMGQWERLNSQEDIIKAMVDEDRIGYTTGVGENQSPVREIANEDVTNYLHTGQLQTSDEVEQILNGAEYPAEESLGRGK